MPQMHLSVVRYSECVRVFFLVDNVLQVFYLCLNKQEQQQAGLHTN